MVKIDLTRKKIVKILVEYILCLIVLEISIVAIGVVKYSIKEKNKTITVSSESSKINTNNLQNEDSINNYKMEILQCDESSYYIKVNNKTQSVSIYALDEQGNYSIPIKTMICSTGVATPVEGVFCISDKYDWGYLVGDVYGQYCTRITGPILFHSVPYTAKDKSTLEYWEYEKLGQPVSKGCVRLKVEDAKWIFDNCVPGTKVEFVSDDDFTVDFKNEDLKISEYSDELKGWDPTDPDPENPWNYNKQYEGEIDKL